MSEIIPIKRPTSVAIPQTNEEVKYPTETIPLPTKGWFYPDGHPLSSGVIEVKQMTAREEDLLANKDLIKRGKVLDKLLESLIVDKSIKIDEILVADNTAIFVAIRRFAYGDEYPAMINCPSCAGQNRIDINLGELKDKLFDFDKHPKGENSFTFTLPKCKKVITYKMLNQVDNNAIDAELVSLKKVSKETSKDLTTRMIYTITSVDGNPDKQFIRKFVDSEELKAGDSLALRKHIRDNSPGIDMSFDFKCNQCDYERRLDIPIGLSFLWPDTDTGR